MSTYVKFNIISRIRTLIRICIFIQLYFSTAPNEEFNNVTLLSRSFSYKLVYREYIYLLYIYIFTIYMFTERKVIFSCFRQFLSNFTLTLVPLKYHFWSKTIIWDSRRLNALFWRNPLHFHGMIWLIFVLRILKYLEAG